jgi:hypothetical protein
MPTVCFSDLLDDDMASYERGMADEFVKKRASGHRSAERIRLKGRWDSEPNPRLEVGNQQTLGEGPPRPVVETSRIE